jgi:hypothetical protein
MDTTSRPANFFLAVSQAYIPAFDELDCRQDGFFDA